MGILVSALWMNFPTQRERSEPGTLFQPNGASLGKTTTDTSQPEP
jgi:hypothetical protein